MHRPPAASSAFRSGRLLPTLGLAAGLFALSCTGLNGAYDSDTSSAGSATSGTRPTDGGSSTGDATTQASAQSGTGTDSTGSPSTTDPTTDPKTTDPETTGASGTAGTEGETEVEPSCGIEYFDIEEDAFLVNVPGDATYANYGLTGQHALFDEQAPGGASGDAVLLMRVGPWDVRGVDVLHLSVPVRPGTIAGGLLRASLITAFNTCDWAEGTGEGDGTPDGVTWALCDPSAGTTWPQEEPLGAIGMDIGSIDLASLPPVDDFGISRVDFPFDLETLEMTPERSVLLYTEGVSGEALQGQSSDADSGEYPYVWFERCL